MINQTKPKQLENPESEKINSKALVAKSKNNKVMTEAEMSALASHKGAMGGYNPNPNAYMQQNMPTFPIQGMFNSMRGIYISQKIELLEVITGCETKNRYYVYERGNDGQRTGKPMLRCKESSGCCARNFISGDCRPFHMLCTNLWNNDQQALRMERDCQCTFLCCNRPEMKVFYTTNGNEVYLGKVVDNFDFCNFTFTVFDAKGNQLYHIEASCCQCGICCMDWPCQACEKVEFKLYNGDKSATLPELFVKEGKKNCCANLVSDADNFSIPFPAQSPWEHRTLLLAAGLLIDYRMFENKNGGRNH